MSNFQIPTPASLDLDMSNIMKRGGGQVGEAGDHEGVGIFEQKIIRGLSGLHECLIVI